MKSFAQSDINLVVKEHGTISGFISLELLPLYVPNGSKPEVGRFAWGLSLHKCPPKTRIAKIIERMDIGYFTIASSMNTQSYHCKEFSDYTLLKSPGRQLILNS